MAEEPATGPKRRSGATGGKGVSLPPQDTILVGGYSDRYVDGHHGEGYANGPQSEASRWAEANAAQVCLGVWVRGRVLRRVSVFPRRLEEQVRQQMFPPIQAMDNWVFDNILGHPSFYHFTAWKLYEARLALQLDEHHGRSQKERWVRASFVLCALLIVLVQLTVTVCFGLALMYPVCDKSADSCLKGQYCNE